jgi:hypothetical protein
LDALFRFLSDNMFWVVVLVIVGGGSILGTISSMHAKTQKRKIAVAEAQVKIAEAKRDEMRAQAEANAAILEATRLQTGQISQQQQQYLGGHVSGPLA